MSLILTPASNSRLKMTKDEIAIASVKSEEDDSQTSLRPYENHVMLHGITFIPIAIQSPMKMER